MDFNTAYQNYYAILNSSYRTGDMVVNDLPDSEANSLVNETNDLITTFLQMVDSLREYERKKETVYLKAWLNKLSKATTKEGKSLVSLLEPLIFGPDPNFTQAFQLIELWRQGFITEVESIQQIYSDWYNEFQQFANKTIVGSARKTINDLGSELLYITPNDLLSLILKNIERDWAANQKNHREVDFQKFLGEFSPYLTKIVSEMRDFRDAWGRGIDLKTVFNIDTNNLKQGTQDLNKTVMSKVVDGLVNGLSQEIMLVAFGGGASTARAVRELKFLSGKSMEVATETDVYAVLNSDLTINQNAVNKIRNFEKDSDIQTLITSSDLNDNFILHYSSKDLTIAESRGSSGAVAKIKGEGGFGSKIPALQEMGDAAGQSNAVHNLIFKAINVGKDLIYDNNKELIDKISTSLTALAFSFMFDDFERQFEQIRKEANQTNTELNIYAISGNYYPASDILTILYNYVSQLQDRGYSTRKSFINIGFKPSHKSGWEIYTSKRNQLSGEGLWKEVRDTVAAEAKMQVRMQTRYLKELTFAIQNPQAII